MLEEVPVDKQKRITISWSTMKEAKLTEHNELYVLKSKEDEDVFYIVDEDFNYDTNRLEYIKSVFHYGFDALRMGIGSLLNVKYGDIVGIDVYDGQLVIYNTDSNVADLTEDKVEETVEKQPEEKVETKTVVEDSDEFEKEMEELNKNYPGAGDIYKILKDIRNKINNKKASEPIWIRRYRIEL